MIRKLSPSILGCLVVLATGLFFSSPAYALSTAWAKGCIVDGTLSGIFCSLSTEFRFIPKTLSLISYAAGITLTMMALLNLREYGDDPSKTPFRDIVMKFVLGALLISLPFAMQVVVRTVLTNGKQGVSISDQAIHRPCSTRGSSIDGGHGFTNDAC